MLRVPVEKAELVYRLLLDGARAFDATCGHFSDFRVDYRQIPPPHTGQNDPGGQELVADIWEVLYNV